MDSVPSLHSYPGSPTKTNESAGIVRFLRLDTNMCIYVINERDRALRERFVEHAGSLCVSSISYADLACGVVRSRRVKHNERELAAFVKDEEH